MINAHTNPSVIPLFRLVLRGNDDESHAAASKSCGGKKGSSLWKSNLGVGRSVLQFGGHCFGALLRCYIGTDGSRGECVHGDDASAAPVSHLQRL